MGKDERIRRIKKKDCSRLKYDIDHIKSILGKYKGKSELIYDILFVLITQSTALKNIIYDVLDDIATEECEYDLYDQIAEEFEEWATRMNKEVEEKKFMHKDQGVILSEKDKLLLEKILQANPGLLEKEKKYFDQQKNNTEGP